MILKMHIIDQMYNFNYLGCEVSSMENKHVNNK